MSNAIMNLIQRINNRNQLNTPILLAFCSLATKKVIPRTALCRTKDMNGYHLCCSYGSCL